MVIEHVGMTVADIEQSVDFYTRVLGFEVLRRTDDNAFIALGSDMVELVQGQANLEQRPEPVDWADEVFLRLGLNHIGMVVDDLDEAVQAIEGRGGVFVIRPYDYMPTIEYARAVDEPKLARAVKPTPGRVWRVAAISDPDGTLIEFVQR